MDDYKQILIYVLVIALFAICFSVAVTIVSGIAFNLSILVILLFELLLAFCIGYALGKAIYGCQLILSFFQLNSKDHMIVTHGYTRLRLGDIVTAVGSTESL